MSRSLHSVHVKSVHKRKVEHFNADNLKKGTNQIEIADNSQVTNVESIVKEKEKFKIQESLHHTKIENIGTESENKKLWKKEGTLENLDLYEKPENFHPSIKLENVEPTEKLEMSHLNEKSGKFDLSEELEHFNLSEKSENFGSSVKVRNSITSRIYNCCGQQKVRRSYECCGKDKMSEQATKKIDNHEDFWDRFRENCIRQLESEIEY